MRQYPMSLSRGVTALSFLGTLLLLGVPVFTWSTLSRGPGAIAAIVLVPTLIVPLIPLWCWALAPKALEIGGGELRVRRRAWSAATWPLSRIDAAAELPPRYLSGAIRTLGNGGLFGYYGWFYKKGAFRLFATRSDRMVEVVVDGKRLVFTPDEPARFVEALLAAAPRARGAQAGGAASASTRS